MSFFPLGDCRYSNNQLPRLGLTRLVTAVQFRRSKLFKMSLASRTTTFARKFASTSVRRSDGIPPPGDNLPFQIQNKWRLTALACFYVGSGFAIPFFALRHQLLKKSL